MQNHSALAYRARNTTVTGLDLEASLSMFGIAGHASCSVCLRSLTEITNRIYVVLFLCPVSWQAHVMFYIFGGRSDSKYDCVIINFIPIVHSFSRTSCMCSPLPFRPPEQVTPSMPSWPTEGNWTELRSSQWVKSFFVWFQILQLLYWTLISMRMLCKL